MAAETLMQIEHVIVVTMENRSFDHFLGWLPGANGKQAGLTYVNREGVALATYPLAPDWQGCGHPNPDHSYIAGRREYADGQCDGWLQAGNNDRFAIGYYRQEDLAFLGSAARDWTVCDHYFAATMAPTIPNRIYQYAAQTDRIGNTLQLCELPTIFDRFNNGTYEACYYFSDVPTLALWGTKYLSVSRRFADFLQACAKNELPRVAYVDPRFVAEALGVTNDDHPFADIRNGEVFLNTVYRAVTASAAWAHTVLVINFDEWGGFFEHVPPHIAEPVPLSDQRAGSDGRRGFRVPCLVISPWSPRGQVNHTLFDHTSVLRMIEERWGLEPLSVRDANADSLALALDFEKVETSAPRYVVPGGPFGRPCSPFAHAAVAPATAGDTTGDAISLADGIGESEFAALLALARQTGWPV